MRILSFFVLLTVAVIAASSCTPNRGCTESTAENYDANAEEDDGTCIASRDKIVGDFSYTEMWTDVLFGNDSIEFGTMQITEANTGANHFNLNLDGLFIIYGSVIASDMQLEPFQKEDTIAGILYSFAYTGSGTWLVNDSINMVIELVKRIPQPDGDPPPWPTIPETHTYYCTKTDQ